ncbi:hypothetical protein FHU38_000988 [Saccharomonospora amisosensis]|uniref:Uncharacterized protein n=1 Tax=Saccharomonospora amisosensis TaxID=1128677 RepID=A0A7X5ZPE8_9PSEU|nr:hypothetical protein [Saccharomonospora amisosensis]NIJ10644.1 hypothetical protein [Saccharomonospora amisosensis]
MSHARQINTCFAFLDRPHSRRRRTAGRNLKRLAAWPLVATAIAITLIGFTQPGALTGSVQPVQRVVIDR